MDYGQPVAPKANVTHAVSEDNVASKSKQRDKSTKGKKSNRERDISSSSKDLASDVSHDVKASRTLENLNENTDLCQAPAGRRRVRSADSAIFAKRRKRRLVKKQVVGVIEDLENVIYEINSVTSELRGVLNQIDRVTSHLELSVDGLDISEDNIFLKSSREQKRIQAAKQRSASCASLTTLNRYKKEINASTQTHRKYEPLITRQRSEVSTSKDKSKGIADQLKNIKENKKPKDSVTSKVHKSYIEISGSRHSLQYCSQLSLASSRGRFPSISGSLAASVSSMTGVLSSSLTSLNTGYNTSLEEIDFGVSWRKRTSPCVTADSSYRTLSETNSLYFEDLLQYNNNSLAPFDYNTNNVPEYCTCDKEFNILGIDKDVESPSMYRQIFSTKTSRRSRSTTASVSSCYSSEDLLKDFSADYNRDINTWTTFAMVHIDTDDELEGA